MFSSFSVLLEVLSVTVTLPSSSIVNLNSEVITLYSLSPSIILPSLFSSPFSVSVYSPALRVKVFSEPSSPEIQVSFTVPSLDLSVRTAPLTSFSPVMSFLEMMTSAVLGAGSLYSPSVMVTVFVLLSLSTLVLFLSAASASSLVTLPTTPFSTVNLYADSITLYFLPSIST